MTKVGILLANLRGVAFCSPEDAEVVESHWWRLDTGGYAATKIGGKYLSLHQLLMGKREGFEIDHANRQRLDCRRENLRWATPRQNKQNLQRKYVAESGCRGVCRRNSKWESRISEYGKYLYLGVYETKEEAARAYDAAALKFHGEFAILNFPT